MIVRITNVCVSFIFSPTFSFLLISIVCVCLSIPDSIVSSVVWSVAFFSSFIFLLPLVATRLNGRFIGFVAALWLHSLDSRLSRWYHFYVYLSAVCVCSLALIFPFVKYFDWCGLTHYKLFLIHFIFVEGTKYFICRIVMYDNWYLCKFGPGHIIFDDCIHHHYYHHHHRVSSNPMNFPVP